jgi:hypothetical protein
MSRHPEDKRRYKEAASKLKGQIERIKEEAFQTHLQTLTETAERLFTPQSNQTIKTTDTTHHTNQKR